MSSLLFVAGTFVGLTTSTMGVAPTTAIGVKSPGMSNGSDFSTLGKITTLLDTTDSVLPSGAERASACRPDDAAGARLVVHHDGGAERLGKRGLRGAGDGVDAGAGGVGQDEADDLGGRLAKDGAGSEASGDGGNQLAAGESHGLVSLSRSIDSSSAGRCDLRGSECRCGRLNSRRRARAGLRYVSR